VEEIDFIGFEVLTAVMMKNIVFYDVAPYSPVEIQVLCGRKC
jgi:hypothetical protein